jgi:hypothetical protein
MPNEPKIQTTIAEQPLAKDLVRAHQDDGAVDCGRGGRITDITIVRFGRLGMIPAGMAKCA